MYNFTVIIQEASHCQRGLYARQLTQAGGNKWTSGGQAV